MATHQLAKGLASLGRHGDSMLMHVSPAEVAGLQALGQMTGHKLHINPDTGMPEAFDFGDFFTSLLPTLVGVGLSPATGGASLGLTGMSATAAPIIGGMATGALVAGAKGEDVLGGALMGGLGGYGGGNLGGSLAKLGAQGGYQAGQLVGPQLTQAGGLSSAGSGQGMMTTLATQAPPSTFAGGLSQVGSGIGELMKPGGFDQFVKPIAEGGAGGSAMQIGAPLAMAGLAGLQPDPYDFAADEEKRKAEENKYRNPITGSLNLSASSGLNLGPPTLAAQGGLMRSYASGGAISGASNFYGTQSYATGGNQDLYGSNDNQRGNQQLSQDGYGIGRLNSLASAGSNAKAADEFYAAGGPIAFAEGGLGALNAYDYEKGGYLDGAGDGMSDSIPATIEGKQPARLADGEFVIPADVVSHLGNGSSKAGSKQLYKMLNKVRHARTGHTKQGKEINPNKYMPA